MVQVCLKIRHKDPILIRAAVIDRCDWSHSHIVLCCNVKPPNKQTVATAPAFLYERIPKFLHAMVPEGFLRAVNFVI